MRHIWCHPNLFLSFSVAWEVLAIFCISVRLRGRLAATTSWNTKTTKDIGQNAIQLSCSWDDSCWKRRKHHRNVEKVPVCCKFANLWTAALRSAGPPRHHREKLNHAPKSLNWKSINSLERCNSLQDTASKGKCILSILSICILGIYCILNILYWNHFSYTVC